MTPLAQERIVAMRDFMSVLDGWYVDMSSVPKTKIFAMMKMGKQL